LQVLPTSNRGGGYRLPVTITVVLIALIALIAIGSAWASGWPPFAEDDSIVVTRGGTVTVLESGASSVLDNDWDIEGDKLTAILRRDVSDGTLLLREDGTFVYKHDGSNDDSDQFRYRAFDGSSDSRTARVRIRVEEVPNNPPFTIGSPGNQQAVANSFFQLNLAQYFDDIDPDDELRFGASGLPNGGRLKINVTSGVLSGTPSDADARDAAYNVRITATDAAGASASLEFALRISPDDRADLALTANVAVNPVTVGEAAQWNVNILNRGPADVTEGELVAQWATSGPMLSMTAPQNCTLSGNNSRTPAIRCALDGLQANNTATFSFQGTQDRDGDNSLIATAVADDPVQGNNAALKGAVVVSAFSEGPAQVLNGSGADVVSGDLNGDGHKDIVVSSQQTIVYLNNGNRSVTSPGDSLGSGSGGNTVALLDWNGDAHLDIAVAGLSTLAARVYLNDGAGNFADKIDLSINGLGTVNAAAAGDFDQDGNDDLVLAGSGNALLAYAEGTNGFATSGLPAVSGMHASVADVNNDGLDDIVVVEAGTRQIRVMRNAGNGRSFNNQSLDRGSVAAATPSDFDRDGDIDLLLAVDDGELAVPESKVIFQQTDGSFSAGNSLGASPVNQMLAGDFDQDGIPDAVAVNVSGVHQVYRGLPSGGFSLNAEQIVSNGMRRGVVVDLNGDGSLDLIFAGPGANVVEIHANNGKGRLGLGDRIAPVITLNGPTSLTLAAGQAYTEQGAVATDDIDGDVSDRITISGTVNTTVVGTYRLTYTATDRSANSASVQRSVQVGVNQGTGGAGGGNTGPLYLFLLAILAAVRRRTAR
jgi:hypothetical protein